MERKTYNIYLPMLKFMLLTACRCGETIGLTWKDIDLDKMEVSINHQLIYKKVGDRICFYAKQPKTKKGIRVIPFTEELAEYLVLQKEYQDILGIKDDYGVDGYSGFVFTTKKKSSRWINCKADLKSYKIEDFRSFLVLQCLHFARRLLWLFLLPSCGRH